MMRRSTTLILKRVEGHLSPKCLFLCESQKDIDSLMASQTFLSLTEFCIVTRNLSELYCDVVTLLSDIKVTAVTDVFEAHDS